MGPGENQLNVEYIFRLLYELSYGERATIDLSAFYTFVANLWLWITVIGYVFSVIGLFVIVYAMTRIFELRKREEHYYSTPITLQKTEQGDHPRWNHIQSLLEEPNPSQWREAIIEADIMLDNALERSGFVGETIGDKLKSVTSARLGSISDAWEAHKVRNQIAHEGSGFVLSEELARRTLSRYENVFRELKVI